MADVTHSLNSEINHDALTSRGAGENITIDGGNSSKVLIDSEPQHTSMGLLGRVQINHGEVHFDATKTRILAWDGRTTGTVAVGDIVSDNTTGAQGEVLRILIGTGTSTSGTLLLRSVTGGVITDNNNLSSDGDGTWNGVANGNDARGYLQILLEEGQDTQPGSNLGTIRATGLLVEIGIGDGTDDQEVEHWLPDADCDLVPFVWVDPTGLLDPDDASDLDSMEIWQNVAPSTLSFAGNGDLGKKFHQVRLDATITFGDDINGKRLPDGAKVYVPNLNIGSSTTGLSPVPQMNSNEQNRHEWKYNNTGTVILDRVSFGSCMPFPQSPGTPTSVTATDVSLNRNMFISEVRGDVTLERVWVGSDGIAADDFTKSSISKNSGTVTLTDIGVGLGGNDDFLLSQNPNLTINKITVFRIWEERDNGFRNFDFLNCDNAIADDINLHGVFMGLGQATGMKLSNIKYADQSNGLLSSSNSVSPISFGNMTDLLIDGFELIQDSAPRNHFFKPGFFNDVKLRNFGSAGNPIDLQNHTDSIFDFQTNASKGLTIDRFFFDDFRSSSLFFFGNDRNVSDVLIRHFGGHSDAVDWDPRMNGGQYQGIDGYPGTMNSGTGVEVDYAGVRGTHFMDRISTRNGASSEGRLNVFFNPKIASIPRSNNAYEITVGAPVFNGIGDLIFPTTNDEIIYTWPYYILGYNGFENVNPSKSGSNTGDIDVEYQIDVNDGNGFNGTWKDATGANLSGETINASDGFKLKLKFKASTGGNNRLLNGYEINLDASETEWDANLHPITKSVTLKITAVDSNNTPIEGATVYAEAGATGPETQGDILIEGFTDANGIFEKLYEYSADQSFQNGWIRQGTKPPLFAEALIQGSITTDGYQNIFTLVDDE